MCVKKTAQTAQQRLVRTASQQVDVNNQLFVTEKTNSHSFALFVHHFTFSRLRYSVFYSDRSIFLHAFNHSVANQQCDASGN